MLSFQVKFVQRDGQTDGQVDSSKTICPRSFDAGVKKMCILFMLFTLI